MDNQAHKAGRFAGPFILILVGGFMLKLSWLKWPDVLIDYGRELYVPWQITQGKVLYADIHHLYGPFAHYFNALLFQIFGTGLSTLVYFNIAMVILLTAIMYCFLKSYFGGVVATTAGICFLVVFAFSQYTGISNYNFICPYSHEIAYGIILFFVTLLTFRKYLTSFRVTFAALIGFLTGLIFLTKAEIFMAAFLAVLTGLVLTFVLLKPVNLRSHVVCLTVFFLLPVIVFFAYFAFHLTPGGAFAAIVSPYINILDEALTHNIYYLRMSGLDDPLHSIAAIFKYSLGYLLVFALVGFVSYFYAVLSAKKRLYGVLLLIASVIFFVAGESLLSVNWFQAARPFPLFIAVLISFLMFRLMTNRDDRPFILRRIPLVTFVIFSFLLLSKMILNVHLYHYGFALAMPATLVVIAFMLSYFPAFVARRGNRNVAVGLMALFILFNISYYFRFADYIYSFKNYPVAEGRDKFYTFAPHGMIMNSVLEQINLSMTDRDTFIVVPEGIMLNYLSRRINPSRYFEFTPNFIEAIGEENMLRDISLARPSFIIYSEKDTSEHGAKYFGYDYALMIDSWIADHYDNVLLLGEEPLSGKGVGFIIAKRKSSYGMLPDRQDF